MPTFKKGDRVRLTQDVDHYPTGYFKAGLTGTFVEYVQDDAMAYVKLDEHRPELDEWDNCLEIVDWAAMNDSPGPKRATYRDERQPGDTITEIDRRTLM